MKINQVHTKDSNIWVVCESLGTTKIRVTEIPIENYAAWFMKQLRPLKEDHIYLIQCTEA